jgi:hypothetical protein
MRSVSGFVLLAGLGVGLFVYLPAPVDRDITLDQAKRGVEQQAAESRPTARPAQPVMRTFSPGIQLAAVLRDKSPSRRGVANVASDGSTSLGEWQTTSVGGASTGANGAASADDLIVDIQKQLKRLGCYYGRIDGSWGEGTKEAVTYFTSRVNAALPVDKPDPVLLTLLKAHGGTSCGASASCPAGQAATADGRCVAQTAAYGSHAGPQSAPAPETLPWKANPNTAQAPQPLFRPVPTSIISSEPLPGRMAIGGPKELPPVDAANAQPGYNGYTQQSGQTAALSPDGDLGANAPAAAPTQRKPRAESRRRSYPRGEGPGTPRYNLLLSLGGAY